MIKVYTEACNIISPLGFSTNENFNNILEGKSGVQITDDKKISEIPLPISLIKNNLINEAFEKIGDNNKYTRFEKLAILSIKDTLKNSNLNIDKSKTLLILSTTKGNIELLENNTFSEDRLTLHKSADIISEYFNLTPEAIVLSNACISGVAAIVLAKRLISSGQYENIIVNGTDVISKFVVSGFQSFMSLSDKQCKPFDTDRNGLNIGEASSTLLLTNKKQNIEVVNGATSNDANHISGPSRTGDGSVISINKTINNKNIDFISAHGTATPYNDDMESVAISRTGLNTVPTNSLKGFFGHTLGAAGILESIISLKSLEKNVLIKSIGTENIGTAEKINIIQQNQEIELKTCLKLASGFGGGNAAVLFQKHE